MKTPKMYLFLLLFLATCPANSENTDQGGYPVYNAEAGTLTIPRVDTPDQVGRYQDVVFQFDPQRNAWILKEHQSREILPDLDRKLVVVPIVSVIAQTVRVSVTIFVSGEYTCSRIGQINQRRIGNLFEIQITEDPLHPTEICDQKTRYFERTIQLDVFRLKAGEYQYNVNNGERIGSFVLPFDTTDPSECGGSPEDDNTPNACPNSALF